MPDPLTLRPRPARTATMWIVLVMLGALTVAFALATAFALADLEVALFFAAMALLFGWSLRHLRDQTTTWERTRADFDGDAISVVRVAAKGGQRPTFETRTVRLADVVRLGYGERNEAGRPTFVTHGCTWVEDRNGERTVLACGSETRATYAKAVADEVARRTGLTPQEDRRFRRIGMFGGMEPGKAAPALGDAAPGAVRA